MTWTLQSIALLSLTICVGCGGSGPATNPDFLALVDESAAVSALVSTEQPTDPSTLPTTGVANYSGVAQFGLSDNLDALMDNPEFLSEADFLVDFDNAALSGQFHSFEDASNSEIAGTMSISDGLITEETFVATASGDVAFAGVDRNIGGLILGEIVGTDAGLLGGAFVGKMESGTNNQDLFGIFSATLQN